MPDHKQILAMGETDGRKMNANSGMRAGCVCGWRGPARHDTAQDLRDQDFRAHHKIPAVPRAYVVTVNVPGYLPDDMTAAPAFTNRRDAERYAASEAREIRAEAVEAHGEDSSLNYRRGSARAGLIHVGRYVVEIHELTGDAAEEALTTFDD
jgi:hypothetical protein